MVHFESVETRRSDRFQIGLVGFLFEFGNGEVGYLTGFGALLKNLLLFEDTTSRQYVPAFFQFVQILVFFDPRLILITSYVIHNFDLGQKIKFYLRFVNEID